MYNYMLEGPGNQEAKSCALEAIMYLARARSNQEKMWDAEGFNNSNNTI